MCLREFGLKYTVLILLIVTPASYPRFLSFRLGVKGVLISHGSNKVSNSLLKSKISSFQQENANLIFSKKARLKKRKGSEVIKAALENINLGDEIQSARSLATISSKVFKTLKHITR